MAAEIDGRSIDFGKIERASEELLKMYDVVLLEGAGGLMVPLTRELLTIDYVAQKDLPLILVTSGRLGSINHTLLSLEAIKHRNIHLHSVVYNLYPQEEDKIIQLDTFGKIERASEELLKMYDVVLLEGAGGLMVPLTRELLTIDYVAQKDLPLILVTSGRLGSINHTLLSLEAIKHRNIHLHSVVYNLYPQEEDKIIQLDTENYIRMYLEHHFPEAQFVKVPCL